MDRAASPVVAVVALVALVVLAAAAVGAAVTLAPPAHHDPVALSLSVDAGTDRLVIDHRAGPALEVTNLSLTVRVSGTPLDHQPPVPFFASEGFESGPTGPLNVAADPTWRAGERGSVTLASTNAPLPDRGDPVTVEVRSDGALLARLRTTAG